MNKEEKAKLWSDRIQQCQTSGKTCKQWCAENGIPLSTMGYWIRRLAKEEPASESEQEAARKLLSEESSSVRIFISDSIRIEILKSRIGTVMNLLDRISNRVIPGIRSRHVMNGLLRLRKDYLHNDASYGSDMYTS